MKKEASRTEQRSFALKITVWKKSFNIYYCLSYNNRLFIYPQKLRQNAFFISKYLHSFVLHHLETLLFLSKS